MIKVFYDGKCGMCSKEINYYIKIAPKNTFEWLDIANNANYLEQIKISQHDALMFLRVQDKDQNLKTGVDAFILIWNNLKYWNFLSIVIKLPVIYQIAILIYTTFAKQRFKKLKHCQLASREVL